MEGRKKEERKRKRKEKKRKEGEREGGKIKATSLGTLLLVPTHTASRPDVSPSSVRSPS